MKKMLMFVIIILMVVPCLLEADEINGQKSNEGNTPGILSSNAPKDAQNITLGGGPDAFGYIWKDSNDPGGPVFNWVDITTVGTEITPWPNGTVDDGYTNPIPMGMTFNFYGIDYTDITVSTNGWVSFLAQTNSYLTNVSIPASANPNGLLAVEWDDLDGGTVGHCYYYYDSAQNQFIVSWVNWPYYPDPLNPHDFQVILNGADNSVIYQYGTGTFRAFSTVGIENETGIIGLQVAYNQAYLTNNLAIKLLVPPVYAHDTAPLRFTGLPQAGSVGVPINPEAYFINLGSNAENNVPVRLVITPGTYNSVQNIPTLASGDSTIVTFSTFTPTTSGIYTLTAISELPGDADRTNDTIRASIIIYDTIMDFESNSGGFPGTGDWQWGTPTSGPNAAFSGVNCWGTNLSGNYSAGISTLEFSLVLGASSPAISFAQWYDTENLFDGCNFSISTDLGGTWTVVSPIGGYVDTSRTANPLFPDSIFTGHGHTSWEIKTFPLTAYAGQTVMAKLALGADPTVFYSGWYVDDLGLIDCQFTFPNIAVSPSNLQGAALPGNSTIVPLTISNTGPGPLHFNARAAQDIIQPLSPIFGSDGNRTLASRQEPIGYRTTSDKEGAKNNAEPYYPPVLTGFGGPDAFGYYWIDSDEPQGPVYGWVDISTNGTVINPWPHGTTDDGYSDPIPMGGTFNFYGIDYTDIVISTNGWISFLPQTSAGFSNAMIPNSSNPNAIIAVEWDDLSGRTTGNCYYYFDAGTNEFIVSWNDWEYYASPYDPRSFQVILDMSTGSIRCQYGLASYHTSSTVGIENDSGTDGLQVAYNQAYLHGEMAILYTAPVQWLSIDPTSGSIPSGGSPVTINVTMDALNLAQGTYTGRIVMGSNDPDSVTFDIPVTFIVGEGGPPPAPALLAPANGSSVTTATVQFDWADAPTATRYVVEVATDDLFNGVVAHDSALTASNYQFDFPTLGTYFWRVTAANDQGFSPRTAVWSFIRTTGGTCQYVVGDANGSNTFNGLDVTYSVNYFKGGAPPPYSCECTPGNTWFVTGDVNGSCSFNGLDVTYMVNYFKGGPAIQPCPNCPPARDIAPNPGENISSHGDAKIGGSSE